LSAQAVVSRITEMRPENDSNRAAPSEPESGEPVCPHRDTPAASSVAASDSRLFDLVRQLAKYIQITTKPALKTECHSFQPPQVL
jgi:hypothetical protein